MADQDIPFTKDELRELIQSGQFDPDPRGADFKLLSRDEHMALIEALGDIKSGSTANQVAAGAVAMAPVGASVGAALVPAAVKGLGGRIGSIAGGLLGAKFGHPFIGSKIGQAFDSARGGGSVGRVSAPSKPTPTPAGPPVGFSGTGGQGVAQGTTIGQPGTFSLPPSQPKPAPPTPHPAATQTGTGTGTGFSFGSTTTKPAAPKSSFAGSKDPLKRPVQRTPPDHRESNSTLVENVTERGVQNNFEKGKRVTIRKPAPEKSEFPSNTSKKSTPAEFKAAKEYDAENSGDDVWIEMVRKQIKDQLDTKKKPRRRSPK